MNADQLLELYDRVADAPDAIPRLRRFVLDLAVRGKLVEQDAADEPASELLKLIAKEKLIEEQSDRKRKVTPQTENSKYEFPSPNGWAIAGLGDVTRIRTGKLDANAAVKGGKYPFFTCSQTPLEIDTYSFEAEAVLLAGNGDFNLKAYSGKFDAYQRTYVIEPLGWSLSFCYVLMRSQIARITEHQRGSAIPYLKLGDITSFLIALPPLAEQHRIVAKVDELMALLDGLEQARAGREVLRDQLTAATLNRLTQTDPDDFHPAAHFALQTLTHLTIRPDQIKTLRQTILNLAVQGKLEPFSADRDLTEQFQLLRKSRISVCLNASEKIKVVSAFEQIEAQWREEPDAPRFVTTLCACRFITKGTTPAPNDLLKTGQVPFLKVYNIVDNKLDFAYRPTFISPVVHNGALARSIVRPGDVLMNIVGPPLGKVALVTDEYPEWNINQALAYFRPMPIFSSRFLALILTAPVTIHEVLKDTRGTVGQDNLSLEQVRSLKIPFVSEVQQHRIVARVDALMALCDQLEAGLKSSDTTRSRLLDAILHSALSQDAVA